MKNIARLIVIGFVGLALVFALLFTFAFSAHGAQAKSAASSKVTTFTRQYHITNDADSSTCADSNNKAINWANDAFTKTYTIASNHIATVKIYFTNASFVTLNGPSPDSCFIGTKTQVGAGIHGTFTGEETIIVKDGTFDSNAVCNSPCTVDDFVHNFYGPNATYTPDSYEFEYATKENGTWRNASNNEGGNFGDIYGYLDRN